MHSADDIVIFLDDFIDTWVGILIDLMKFVEGMM